MTVSTIWRVSSVKLMAGRVSALLVTVVLLAGACSSAGGGPNEVVVGGVTDVPLLLQIEAGTPATVEVFFGFPVVTIADFVPSDVECSFSGATIESLARPAEITVESRGDRELTPLGTYIVRGVEGAEIVCIDHAARTIDLAVIVSQ